MVIAATSLTSGGSTTDQAVYTTASVTPLAGQLTFVAVWCTHATVAEVPIVTGNGVTYTHVGTAATTPPFTTRMSVFASLTANGAGAITLTFDTAHQGCMWAVDTYTGHDARSLSYAIAHQDALFTPSGTTTATYTYAPPPQPSSGFYGAGGLDAVGGAEVVTLGAGFTQLGRSGITGPIRSIISFWKPDTLTTVPLTWTTGSRLRSLLFLIRPALTTTQTHSTAPVLSRRRRR